MGWTLYLMKRNAVFVEWFPLIYPLDIAQTFQRENVPHGQHKIGVETCHRASEARLPRTLWVLSQ
jgi:hypothetical protein